MSIARTSHLDPELEALLEATDKAPRRSKVPTPAFLAPRTQTRFEKWAFSQIAAYRIGLTITYIATIYFGISSLVAGIPVFALTAPEGWTPIWASVVVLGGIAGTFGSWSDSKMFNRIELGGAWALLITLGTYAIVLLFIAYATGDPSRAAVGAGFVALGVTPGVRMLWLMSQFRRSL